ncbi:MAG TPA: UDP-N-acetylmuramate dehydrogenase [Saprospiraceae bacterium]|nr:UDP-N-acetylmuramate dehydrogenase [Saprospiraceae bacterium]
MQVKHQFSLKELNTFGIGVFATAYCAAETEADVLEAIGQTSLPVFVLGGGSNILFTEDIQAFVLHNKITGIEIVEESDSDIIIKAGGGEVWHSFVLWCIDKDYGGIENLSLIPGTVGAAPVQNIGAYGVELKDVFHSLEAIDLLTGNTLTFSKEACKFGYRDSIFKHEWKGRLIISRVYFQLTKKNHKLHSSYAALKSELDKQHITDPGILDISRAVIAVRQSKLPDPKTLGNAGSFFKNPEISRELFLKIQEKYPSIPPYPAAEGLVKIPAGWLIEQRGWKGRRKGNCGSYEQQALVLVNYNDATGKEILQLATEIIEDVYDHFGVKLSPEVNIM